MPVIALRDAHVLRQLQCSGKTRWINGTPSWRLSIRLLPPSPEADAPDFLLMEG